MLQPNVKCFTQNNASWMRFLSFACVAYPATYTMLCRLTINKKTWGVEA